MLSVTVAACLQLSVLSAGGSTYAEAYKSASESGRPMVILIGADWCPACQVMKNTTLPQLKQTGGLKDVNVVILNYDHQPNLCRKLMRGNSIPQLVMYYQTEEGWRRNALVGRQSTSAVEGMVRVGVQSAVAFRESQEPRVAQAKDTKKTMED